ncbi:acyl-CoA hydrolase [Lewinella aquimaris]|uniref:Acyl-CoA hydrolase n=2 Tax=Neolewinella aquimaris TaxID=1835722 RepID=A0A840E3H5_9BACT|nr:acyl-CoA thioesterase [Neolewinella aquimaris]MBB4078292.1 acyl-CoA hydrolase [Neolewinella aquimaris]
MSRPAPKRVAESSTTMSELVMPNDTNPQGNLMGGNMLRWMDICCAICAGKHCAKPVVTASVDNVAFQSAIKNGEVITLEANVTRAFNTSIEVYVEVFAATMQGTHPRRTHHAFFTFVALDRDNGSPVPVPELLPLTDIEQQRYEAALNRRELRLVLAGRLKPEQAGQLQELFRQQA